MDAVQILNDLESALLSAGKTLEKVTDWELYDPFHDCDVAWDGVNDDPRVAWFFLDILDTLLDGRGNRSYWVLGAAPNYRKEGKSVPRDDGMTHYCGSVYGRTRTEAVALWFIHVHKAGMFVNWSKDFAAVSGSVTEKGE